MLADGPASTDAAPELTACKPRQHRKGRQVGEKDFTFKERLDIIEYAKKEGLIVPHKSGTFINGLPPGVRNIQIPWSAQNVQVAVDTVLDWQKASVRQMWTKMIANELLIKDLGAGWEARRSRLPNQWRRHLNDTACGNMRMLGQPSLLTRRPQLLGVLSTTDELHCEERSLKEPATASGFMDTFTTQLDLAKSDNVHAQTSDPSRLPAKVSKSWVQQRLKHLRATEIRGPCAEANTVTAQDDETYKQELSRKLSFIGDLRLQMSVQLLSG